MLIKIQKPKDDRENSETNRGRTIINGVSSTSCLVGVLELSNLRTNIPYR